MFFNMLYAIFKTKKHLASNTANIKSGTKQIPGIFYCCAISKIETHFALEIVVFKIQTQLSPEVATSKNETQ